MKNTRKVEDWNEVEVSRTVANSSEILPFPEEPRVEAPTGSRKRTEAGELFSLFTADIIKQNTVFSR